MNSTLRFTLLSKILHKSFRKRARKWSEEEDVFALCGSGEEMGAEAAHDEFVGKKSQQLMLKLLNFWL